MYTLSSERHAYGTWDALHTVRGDARQFSDGKSNLRIHDANNVFGKRVTVIARRVRVCHVIFVENVLQVPVPQGAP
jgi:hypothetical protein